MDWLPTLLTDGLRSRWGAVSAVEDGVLVSPHRWFDDRSRVP